MGLEMDPSLASGNRRISSGGDECMSLVGAFLTNERKLGIIGSGVASNAPTFDE